MKKKRSFKRFIGNFLWWLLDMTEELEDFRRDIESDADSKISEIQHDLGRLENIVSDLENNVEADIDDLKAEIRNLHGAN